MIGFVTWPPFMLSCAVGTKGWPSDQANHINFMKITFKLL